MRASQRTNFYYKSGFCNENVSHYIELNLCKSRWGKLSGFTGPSNLLALQIERFGSRLRLALVELVVDSAPVKTAGLQGSLSLDFLNIFNSAAQPADCCGIHRQNRGRNVGLITQKLQSKVLLYWKERCIASADCKFGKKEINLMGSALYILVLLTFGRWPSTPASKIAALSSNAMVVTWSGIPIQGRSPENQPQTHSRIIRIWKAHADRVRVAKFSPDGTQMVSASNDQTARIWDVLSGKLIATCTGHKGVIFDAEFSHDGKHVLTISEDGTARIWEAATGQPLATFQGSDDYILFAFFLPDRNQVVSVSDNGTIRTWDTATGKIAAPPIVHKTIAIAAAISPDGTRMVIGTEQKTRLWNLKTGQIIATLGEYSGRAESLMFSHDGKRIFAPSPETARIWDAATGKSLATLEEYKGGILTASFSPDDSHIITGGSDSTVRLWETAGGRSIAVLKGHKFGITAVSFSPDGSRIVTAGGDGIVRIWNAATAREMFVLEGPRFSVESAMLAPDGRRLVTAAEDGTMRLWDVTSDR